MSGRPDIPDVCPGIAMYVPKAFEVAEAYNLLQAGELDAVWAKPLRPMQRELLRRYARATNRAEDWRQDVMEERARNASR